MTETKLTLRTTGRGMRRKWPWRDMLVGDIVYLYGKPSLIRDALTKACAHARVDDPNLKLRTLTVYPEDGGDPYGRVEAVDLRIEGIERNFSEQDRADRREADFAAREARLAELRAQAEDSD